MMKLTCRIVALLAMFAACCGVVSGQSAAPTKDRDWPAYNGGRNGDHYSALKQIDKSNVSQLQVAWQFDTGEKGGMQSNPLIVGRVLYAYTPSQKVIALDAVTGKLLWKFESGVVGTQPNRGVAYWTDGKQGRVLAGVMNYLYALDSATGKPIASFGGGGRIDLRKGLRVDGKGDEFEQQSVVLTTPGLVYKDLIVVGGRNPETHPAPPGDVRAFDVLTGALRWRFQTIPHPGQSGYETWPKDAWRDAGAANNWAGMSLDAARGILYVPTGSAVFDFYGGDRIGDDLFANTLLALDAATGKRLWHFQGVHHDIWDRDFPAPPALVTVKRDGKSVDAVAQTTKQGWVYLFDRVTGKPLFPIEERAYPASTVVGEVTARTQPLPTLPAPYGRQRLTEEMLTNRTAEAHAWAVKEFRTFRSEGQFVPFSVGKQTVVFPGFDGGAEWGGPAVDPNSGVLYVNENEMAWTGGLEENKPSGNAGADAYRSQCGMCHGTNLGGSPPAFPSLVGVDKRLTDSEIESTIAHGKGRMPSLPNLSAEEAAGIVKYLKALLLTEAGKTDKQELVAGAVPNPVGGRVYAEQCAACHGEQMEGQAPSVPMLAGVGSRLSIAQVVEVLRDGKGVMPASPELKRAELDALLRYIGMDLTAKPNSTMGGGGKVPYRFTGYRKFLDPDGYPAIALPWGTLNAIDLNTGKYLWRIPLGEYPALMAEGLKATGTENYGGPIVTAGGVVFIGATVFDRKFRAFDSGTGELLWETQLPFGGLATPATYSVEGRQFVVIAAAGGRDPKGPTGGSYVAFSLPVGR